MALLVATDSSYHLGFKSIDEVIPAELGLTDPSAEWLVATTVIEELDNIGNASLRNKSKVARAEKAVIIGALEGRAPLASGIAIHNALDALDVAYGLDASLNDNRILASLLRYRDEHPGTVITLVTDDAAMRIRARGLGLEVVDPAETLARAPIKDDVELELERARTDNAALRSAGPQLSLAFAGRAKSQPLAASLYSAMDQENLDLLIDDLALAEAHVPTSPLLGVFTEQVRENPNYALQLAQYREKLRPRLAELHVIKNRTLTVELVIHNNGLKQAEDVRVEIALAAIATIHAQAPALEEKLPRKPRPVIPL